MATYQSVDAQAVNIEASVQVPASDCGETAPIIAKKTNNDRSCISAHPIKSILLFLTVAAISLYLGYMWWNSTDSNQTGHVSGISGISGVSSVSHAAVSTMDSGDNCAFCNSYFTCWLAPNTVCDAYGLTYAESFNDCWTKCRTNFYEGYDCAAYDDNNGCLCCYER